MKKMEAVLRNALPMVLVLTGFCYVGQTAIAQNSDPHNVVSGQDMQQPGNQRPAVETKTFTGKIVKSGNMLVLSDPESKATYKLDEQKAKEFVNKDVKVIGVLDDSTGVIRVSAIEPA